MLQNYMHLVTAVVTSSMLEIDEGHIRTYEEAILRYLRGIKKLYKEAEIKANHHMALHVGAFLRRFGPVHSMRTFFSERMNFVLQGTNSNSKFGKLVHYLNGIIPHHTANRRNGDNIHDSGLSGG